MTTRLILLLATALLCWAAPLQGQTIKSLGYNTTNGQIVAATNVTFTNSVGFATNARAATRTNLGGTTVGDAVFTATNAAVAAAAMSLGATNDVTFNRVATTASGSLSNPAIRIGASNTGLNSVAGFLFGVSKGESVFGAGPTGFSVTPPATFITNVNVNGSLVGTGPATFSTNVSIAGSLSADFLAVTNAATTRTNLGGTTVGNAVFTATNAAAAATAVGLGTTNTVHFISVVAGGVTNVLGIGDIAASDQVIGLRGEFGSIDIGGYGLYVDESGRLTIDAALHFYNITNAATTRTNLGLGLPALTNDSNVTMMRALAGSTNTNQPFSGSISVVGTNNTNTLVFSNGILLSQ